MSSLVTGVCPSCETHLVGVRYCPSCLVALLDDPPKPPSLSRRKAPVEPEGTMARLRLMRSGVPTESVAHIVTEEATVALFEGADEGPWALIKGLMLFEVIHLGAAQLRFERSEGAWSVTLLSSRFVLSIDGVDAAETLNVVDGTALAINGVGFRFEVCDATA